MLTKTDFGSAFKYLSARTGQPISALQHRIKTSQAEQQGVTGNNDEFFRLFRDATRSDILDSEIIEFQTHKAILGPIPVVIDLKRRLAKAGYAVGILSNSYSFVIDWQKRTWPELLETYGGPEIFSHMVHVAKPDPKIYALISGFDRIIFIEDKHAYLRYPVTHLGWIGVVMTAFQDSNEATHSTDDNKEELQGLHVVSSPESLEQLLRELGLKF